MPVLELADVDLHYEVNGIGKPLVMIHHLAGATQSWELVVNDLASKFWVITYDLRGHGKSSVPPSRYTISDHAQDLKALLEYLGVKDPIVVGHSIGSLIAIEYALKNPVSKLVLMGALYRAPDPIPYMRYMDIATRFGMEALAFYRRLNGEIPTKITQSFWLWSKFLQLYRNTSVVGYINTVRGLLEAPNYESEIGKLEGLTLIYGSEDRLKANMEVFRKAKANYFEIPETGHFPNLETPGELLRILNSI
ncbi:MULTISPECIES: alpha/beta fold hydrolase [Metallosphaera]|uniref:Alpha/beta hydrolase fold protein n=3 Tax=Metallosphaera TaxID=41980 RepID=A4YIK9_METS5|nr:MULTISPECIES: alpha/beta hydrolase [Metallosphaera]ABP96261.1 alpha/beta hydrolase fold protein [Metallosphaera sedula DSM 5348]AIM28244.1 alpha/beta hydrolase fold protein [Metallosphaera sedula]MCY0861079.1 alpha/beta hydrolase [Metallosphaera prunae]QCO30351.1 alpha/beta hydrolase [Metallosphaera prunae]WPX06081.1 alpha/beta hydrolase [Metallosphaera sedula DSM 5348]